MNTPHQLTLALPNPLAAREALFLSTHGQPYTTSRAVVERFGQKLHKNVLRDIEKLLADMPDTEFRRLNFEPTMYPVPGPKGAVRYEREYRMTHDGFAQRDRYVAALDVLCPSLRPTVEGTVAGQDRTTIAAAIGKTCASVTYYRGKSRRLGLLPASHHMALAEGGAA